MTCPSKKEEKMRKILFITTYSCPRCGYVRGRVFVPLQREFPEDVKEINGSENLAFVRRHGVKGAPAFLFLIDGERRGLIYSLPDLDGMKRWLRGGRYKNDTSAQSNG